ncbi:MAG: hypothetical protein GIX02_13885 [Candidatus Eremiobacteraeota bacterium]|nr:hypothetical protein [Candidatus Eremiobacteraeota bacterium]
MLLAIVPLVALVIAVGFDGGVGNASHCGGGRANIALTESPATAAVHQVKKKHTRKKRKPACGQPEASSPDSSRQEERLLRRRVVRLARIAMLERREALLSEFLVGASTERQVMRDDRRHALAEGIEFDDVSVTLDFVGSPIIRARVTNTSPDHVSYVVTAVIATSDGPKATASLAIERLAPHESRRIELLCPAALVPSSIEWSAARL